MGLPAQRFELENTMEQRVAMLETHVEHIRSDIAEMKGDVRCLDRKIDTLGDKLSRHTFWIVGLLATVAIALMSLMTGGFLWLADKTEP